MVESSVEAKTYSKTAKLMGNRFDLTVVDVNELNANRQIDLAIAEISRIEGLFTTYSPESQCNQINNMAGVKPVKVDDEVFELIKRSIKISELTQGAFDITYGGVDKSLWNFDQNMKHLPSKNEALKSVRLIDYKKMKLDSKNNSVFLLEKGMRIGFGGIGKGYAADMAKILLQKNGVKSGVVNASGDMTTWGSQPNGTYWTIGIADPNTKNAAFSSLNISNMAIATSGNYEKYITIAGKKYSHTIDPKTGMPISGIKSVTVIAPNAELADALATPVAVMGVVVGIDMINQLKGIACIIIDDNDKIHTSHNVNIV